MSTSSGEEVDVFENHIDEGGQAKNFHWHNDHVKKLASYVASNLTTDDNLAPYDTVTIDWKDVEEMVGVDPEKCQRKWKGLLNSVRTYRTMPEILLDIMSQNSKTEISKFNKAMVAMKSQSQQTRNSTLTMTKKKKRKVNPCHPKRPMCSGYAMFCSQKMKEMPDVKGVALMLKLAPMWKDLSEPKRIEYNLECAKHKEAYLEKVQEYARQHPEDVEIKEILAEEVARVSKTSRKKGIKKVVKGQEEPALADKTMDDTVLTNETDGILESPKKTPKKKRHIEEDSQDSSPSKKKKKLKEKVWTAEGMYMESKIEGYRLDHANMDEEDVQGKLKRKFNKLSEEKKAKYRRKAEERNS